MRLLLPAALLSTFSTPVLAQVVINGPPAGPLPNGAGGMCEALQISTNPAQDFGSLNANTFHPAVNTFVDNGTPLQSGVVRAIPLDLAGPTVTGPGDFSNATVNCASAGCDLPLGSNAGAIRLRAYLRVPMDWVGAPLHLGLLLRDAASLTVFDGNGVAYPVLVQPPLLGFPLWRSTQTVSFLSAGLYPVELQLVQFAGDGALEVSMLNGAFTDFQRPANQAPVVDLFTAGFTLLDSTNLTLSLRGQVPSDCAQCPRAAPQAGSGPCAAGTWCGPAAVCEPCEDATHCGSTCAACTVDKPFCKVEPKGTTRCVGCLTAADCPGTECLPSFECDAPDAGPADAAMPTDAAVTPDAAAPPDAAVTPDAAVPPDAAVTADAAVTTDASVAPDAAVSMDAAVRMDAAQPRDASAPPDAAVNDGGDAAVGGTDSGSGGDDTEPSRCGCNTADASAPAWAMLVAFAAMVRVVTRRRVRG